MGIGKAADRSPETIFPAGICLSQSQHGLDQSEEGQAADGYVCGRRIPRRGRSASPAHHCTVAFVQRMQPTGGAAVTSSNWSSKPSALMPSMRTDPTLYCWPGSTRTSMPSSAPPRVSGAMGDPPVSCAETEIHICARTRDASAPIIGWIAKAAKLDCSAHLLVLCVRPCVRQSFSEIFAFSFYLLVSVAWVEIWLGNLDSNQDRRSQSPLFYH